ncbi:UL6 [Gallid alphaherpesvirus 2]|nr:UL6 [Gallid alphaherpesvirus 2]UOW64146.1 UL6 [Gallid alphaherpesvirus 2]
MDGYDRRAPYDLNSRKINHPDFESVMSQRDIFNNVSSKQCMENQWIVIHPTRQTRMFKEILAGRLGYTDGQGIYNSVRSTETAIRQIQNTILTLSLDAVRYDDLKNDWIRHADMRGMSAKKLARTYGMHSEAEAVKVAENVFVTWRKTLQTTLINLARQLISCFTTANINTSSFSKYIDWICCLGIVPVVRHDRSARATSSIPTCAGRSTVFPNWAFHDASSRLRVVDSVMARGKQIVNYLSNSMSAVSILEYDRTLIEYNFFKRELRVKDILSGERGECIVIWRPVMNDGGVIFDSPMQRIYKEIIECHDLRQHATLCRLVNTAPVKVLIAKRDDGCKGVAGAQRVIDKVLGDQPENAASSAASRLVKLIIGLKGMRHVGDITDTVRDYLEETSGHLLDAASIDTSQPGFGQSNRAQASTTEETRRNTIKIRDAFHSSVVTSINEMLEGYVNKLFNTVEGLKAANKDLLAKLCSKELELDRVRTEHLISKQAHTDMGNSQYSPTLETLARDLKHDVIDVGEVMDDDSYVANSFQSRYIPAYDVDLKRLSELWEQEMLRCFKLTRATNNQGHEVSISYSNSAITLLLAPYFFSVLNIYDIGPIVTNHEVYKSEEELCNSVFEKTRIHVYLDDLALIFNADVKRAIAKYFLVRNNSGRQREAEDLPDGHHGRRNYFHSPSSRRERYSRRSGYKRHRWNRESRRDYRRTQSTTNGEDDDGSQRD